MQNIPQYQQVMIAQDGHDQEIKQESECQADEEDEDDQWECWAKL